MRMLSFLWFLGIAAAPVLWNVSVENSAAADGSPAVTADMFNNFAAGGDGNY